MPRILETVVLIVVAVIIVPRTYKNIVKKRETPNAYAIQNVQSGKAVRVHDAGLNDGRKIISYNHQNWECITWQFIQLEENTYLLKNLYTQKTLQPSSFPKPGVTLWQQPLGGDKLQYWEFLKQPDESYLIRLKGTDLYIIDAMEELNVKITGFNAL